MKKHITNGLTALAIIALLITIIICYQWIKDCPKNEKPLVIFPSASITLIDWLSSCHSKIAHNEAKE